MYNYSALIIRAYSAASGCSLADSIADLGLSGAISPAEVETLSAEETDYLDDMLKNGELVRSWRAIIIVAEQKPHQDVFPIGLRKSGAIADPAIFVDIFYSCRKSLQLIHPASVVDGYFDQAGRF